MSLTRRYAAVGAVLGAVLAGGGLLSAGLAVAADTPTVTFSGGCGTAGAGAGAASEPDAASLSVPAEGLVVFVNHLGQTASLLVDDRAAGTLRANDQVSVIFHHGPVSVKLAPACLATADADPVYVAVAAGAPGPVANPAVRVSGAAAGPVVAQATAHRRGASKILVLVAAICVVGVSFATIRAIIAQRAIRTASA
jgi:hypothetical protein